MQRIKYSVEFKKEAARRLIIDGLSASEVSEKLGVKAELLYRWKREHLKEPEGAIGSTDGSSPTNMDAEIDRLRKELGKSHRINEIL